MVFRLPSQLEALVPPPVQQHSQPTPWRGMFIVSGLRSSDRSSSQEISVTAVETDGDKAHQWPNSFFVRILHDQPVLREFQAWLKACVPPIPVCTLMANRIRETNLNTVNQTNFRSLSRILFENQTVAIASWDPNNMPGSGMVIYPAPNSSAVLVGALFFDMPFPQFISGVPSPISPMAPHMMQHSSRHPQYQQRISTNIPYVSSPHHRPSLSPHHSDHNSPVEQPIASHHRQDPNYRYIMPRSNHPAYSIGQPSSSSEIAWTNIKDEEENGYASFSSHQNPPYT